MENNPLERINTENQMMKCIDTSVCIQVFNSTLWLCVQYMETISSRQMDMQKFIADGCREALLEEKRRFCFLADKHCMFSYQISNFHDKVSLDRDERPAQRDPSVMHRLTPVPPPLSLSLVSPGQRDAVYEAPQLAG